MRILMTGATGFLGSRVISSLVSDNDIETLYSVSRKGSGIHSGKVIDIKKDINDLEDVSVEDCDICLHIAGITNNEQYSDEDVFRVNSLGTASVIECCKRNGIRKIIYISSVNVLLEHRYAYGNSKAEAEKKVKESGLEYIILRPALIYGSGCKSFQMIASYIKKFHVVPVFGKGDAVEQPVYIDEMVDFICYYLKSEEKNTIHNIFGLTPMKYTEMVKAIADTLGTSCKILHVPVKPVLWLSEKNILSSIRPEQIYHATENLTGEAESSICRMNEFSENIKYIRND